MDEPRTAAAEAARGEVAEPRGLDLGPSCRGESPDGPCDDETCEAHGRAEVAEPGDGLTPFLRRVESDHRQGDWTEDGWVGNSINGAECVKDGQRWPCSAAALRLAILDGRSRAATAGREPLDALRLARAMEGDGPDVTDGVVTYDGFAARVIERLAALDTPDPGAS